jgi:hypothetical protein
LALLVPGGSVLHLARYRFHRLSHGDSLWRIVGTPRHNAFAVVCRNPCRLPVRQVRRTVPASMAAGRLVVCNYGVSWPARCHDRRRPGDRFFLASRPASLLLALASDSGFTHRARRLLHHARVAYHVERDSLDLVSHPGSARCDKNRELGTKITWQPERGGAHSISRVRRPWPRVEALW